MGFVLYLLTGLVLGVVVNRRVGRRPVDLQYLIASSAGAVAGSAILFNAFYLGKGYRWGDWFIAFYTVPIPGAIIGSLVAVGLNMLYRSTFTTPKTSTPTTAASPTTQQKPKLRQPARQEQNPQQPTTSPPPAEHQRVPGTIFISYRREDAPDIAGRVYDRLAQHFGEDAVFKDVDSIPFGVDFRTYLAESVAQCSIFLAVIGRNWTGSAPVQRLDDPRDFVRIELEAALQRDIPVVPVLVQGAVVPEEAALPPSIQSLSYRNGLAVRPDPDFHNDMNRLIQSIEKYFRSQQARQ